MQSFKNVLTLVDRLHAKNGCPWDRKQTLQSTKKYLLEETYEVLEAIEENNDHKLKEELGDLLFQVLTCAKIAQKNKRFRIRGVFDAIHEKMVRRHPHVFGVVKVKSVRDILNNWNRIKHLEKPHRAKLPFGQDIPSTLPALRRAEDLYKKLLQKTGERYDAASLLRNLRRSFRIMSNPQKRLTPKIMGRFLFDLSTFSAMKKISPEESLRKANRSFEKETQRLITKHQNGKSNLKRRRSL